MYDNQAGYSKEALLAANAVRAVDADVVLSFSPGGGMTVDSAAWVAGAPGSTPPSRSVQSDSVGSSDGAEDRAASGPQSSDLVQATMYRVTGDFHAKTKNLDAHAFFVGNLTARGLIGANQTWPDCDIMDLGRFSAYYGKPEQWLHASMYVLRVQQRSSNRSILSSVDSRT